MKTITICGSMQFSKEMQRLREQLEQKGYVVLLPDISENNKLPDILSESEMRKVKKGFIEKHFSKIQQADAILVANYEKKGIKGYIGSNTLMEIAVAYVKKKKIFILHTLGEQGCIDEVRALSDKNLGGNIGHL